MKKRLTHIGPLKFGIVFGILNGLVSLVFMVPFALLASVFGAAATARPGAPAMPAVFTGISMIFLPVIYAVFGFVCGIISALIYNLIAKWTGGIEFTTEEVTPPVGS